MTIQGVWERQGTSDKYVVFGIDGESYCLPILSPREIIADYALTPMPNLPKIFHGVVSVRGQAIPVINLHRRFGVSGAKAMGI